MPGNVRLSGTEFRPDFILGDRYGTSASAELSRAALGFLNDLGYSAVRNKPYAGGFITEHYGRPARGLHALQIEINRSEEHTSELQSLMRISYAVFWFEKKIIKHST